MQVLDTTGARRGQLRSSLGHHRRRSRRSGDWANSTELQSARSAHLLAAKLTSRSLSLKPLASSASYIDTRPYVDGGGPDVAPPRWSDRVTGLLHDAVRPSTSSAADRDKLSQQYRSDVSLNVWQQQLEQLHIAVQIAGARCVLYVHFQPHRHSLSSLNDQTAIRPSVGQCRAQGDRSRPHSHCQLNVDLRVFLFSYLHWELGSAEY